MLINMRIASTYGQFSKGVVPHPEVSELLQLQKLVWERCQAVEGEVEGGEGLAERGQVWQRCEEQRLEAQLPTTARHHALEYGHLAWGNKGLVAGV